jgi:hypothetical protein
MDHDHKILVKTKDGHDHEDLNQLTFICSPSCRKEDKYCKTLLSPVYSCSLIFFK